MAYFIPQLNSLKKNWGETPLGAQKGKSKKTRANKTENKLPMRENKRAPLASSPLCRHSTEEKD
jgi:hypothetical protein